MSSSIILYIKSRSGKDILPDGIRVDATATVDDLKQRFSEQKRKYYPSRQRFTLPPAEGQRSGAALEAGKRLSEYGLVDGSVLVFKDLGPQVGYRTVFFWEYLGPLVVYASFYFLPALLTPGAKVPAKSPVQTLALAYWSFHYTKRIAETFLVHRFSHATMPIGNLFKNCSYYWGFAAFISYYTNHALYTAPPVQRTQAALGLALLCQLANLRCHVILAGLRSGGAKGYTIPSGFLFNYITCANYTTEILGWVCFCVATQCLPVAFFTAAGALQMAQWAAAKHRRLRRLFDGQEGRPKYPSRWVMLPPIF